MLRSVGDHSGLLRRAATAVTAVTATVTEAIVTVAAITVTAEQRLQ